MTTSAQDRHEKQRHAEIQAKPPISVDTRGTIKSYLAVATEHQQILPHWLSITKDFLLTN